MSDYTPEQIKQAIKHFKQIEELGAEYMNQDRYHALTILAALKAAQKERDYEREEKQYYVGVGAELRLKLTEAQHEITKDIHDMSYTDNSLNRTEKALAYAQTDNVKLKERVEGLQNGMKTLVDQRERLTTSVEALATYAAKLEKAGDGIRNYKPDSNPLQAEIDIEELFDAWDAVRKERP